LRVTHPEARRYFMTIPEASQLVIQSALLGQSGDVFILDMGEQVRILDVARQLIRLNGLEPDRDIQIAFTGLRPGEKLQEELLTHTERTRTTCHAKIFRCELAPVSWGSIDQAAREIIEQAYHDTPDRIRTSLTHLVPEYASTEPELEPVAAMEAVEETGPEPLPAVREHAGKRILDVIGASISLLVLAVPVAVAWGIVHLSGPGSVTFHVERRIGLNRRRDDRRVRSAKVGIDRREQDRRTRSLPGRPFVTYRMVLERPRRAGSFQTWLAHWVERLHVDRLLFLWNVLRGDMSFVGPSSHLLEADSWKQDEISAWCFARRPGLTGPASLLEGVGEEAILCDRYYGRHANWHLDLDALRLALPRLLRPRRNNETEQEGKSASISVSARRSGEGKGGIA
jgi:lipopolysaccharide/colanic/teichoic acid biosynthesis glycosyltransferase